MVRNDSYVTPAGRFWNSIRKERIKKMKRMKKRINSYMESLAENAA